MTPEEKRKLLKREMLKDAIRTESEEEITPAVAPADAPRETSLQDDAIDAARAVSQGLSPLSDELAAGIEGGGDAIEAALGLRGDISLSDAYRTHKNQYDKNLALTEERSPTMSKVGEIGTAILTPVNGETTLAKTIATGLIAALGGAGKSKSNPMTDPEGLAMDTGFSGGLGLGLGYAGGKVAEKFGAKGMEKIANDKAKQAVLRSQSGAMRNAPDDMGRELIDSGVVTFGAKAGTMHQRAVEASRAAGQAIGKLLSDVDEAIGEPFVNGAMIAERIRTAVARFQGRGNRAVMEKMLEEADAYESMGLMPFARAQQEKISWKFSDKAVGDPIRSDAAASNALKAAVAGEIEDALERVPAAMRTKPYLAPRFASSQSLKGEYKALNRRYGATEAAEDGAEVLAARQEANLSFGLREWLAGATVAGVGVDMLADTGGGVTAATLATMIGAKIAKERGPSAIAIAADKVARLQRSAPEIIEKIPIMRELQFNPMIGAVHLALMESDPAYKVEVSNAETKMKAPRVKIAGEALPYDLLGDDPFFEHTQLSQALLAAKDGDGHIKNPEALAQLAALISGSDSYDSVQKAKLLSAIAGKGRIDIAVSPEPPVMLQRPPAPPPVTADRALELMKAASGG